MSFFKEQVRKDPTDSMTVLYGISLVLAFLSYLFYNSLAPSKKSGIRNLGGFSVFTAWTFFTKRYDFLWGNFEKDPSLHFRFNVLHHEVVAMRGKEARQKFFDTKNLSSIEGYKVLMGSAPSLNDVDAKETIQSEEGNVAWFNKQLATLFTNKKRLGENLPKLFADINKRMDSWGQEGKIDPFKNIYDLVFQMTVRMATCDELATNLKDLDRIQDLYWTLEKSATPTALLLPWFPGSAKKAKQAATTELFMTLSNYVELRRKAIEPSTDAIDILIAQELPTAHIVQFILGVVFAGVLNTGIISCWTILNLVAHPDWYKKVRAELEELMSQQTASDEPLHKRLASVPVSAWEDGMPSLELVIRETQRLALSSTAFRRNLTDELAISGGVIKPGEFMAYSLADVHRNSEIYTRPDEFDPERFAPGREEDKKALFGFLGWGVGRHPCTGMRVAKLEIKIITAMMLLGYDFNLVDSAGKPANKLPDVNKNDIHQSRPIGKPVYLKFKRVVQ